MADKDPKDTPEVAEPMETPDAPAADVPKPKAKREEVIAATDAIDEVPEEAEALAAEVADEPAEPAAKPAKKPAKAKAKAKTEAQAETSEPAKAKAKASKPAAADAKADAPKPGREATPDSPQAAKGTRGKIARDKHGRPIVDGPVVQAHAKYVRTSARKARLVCDHIRGKSVDDAVAILAHTPRAVAEDWEKLLKSAVANAEHNHELLGEDLKIHAVFADEGPTLKRFRPRAMGRATKIRKRTSHLTIQLTPKEQ